MYIFFIGFIIYFLIILLFFLFLNKKRITDYFVVTGFLIRVCNLFCKTPSIHQSLNGKGRKDVKKLRDNVATATIREEMHCVAKLFYEQLIIALKALSDKGYVKIRVKTHLIDKLIEAECKGYINFKEINICIIDKHFDWFYRTKANCKLKRRGFEKKT